MTRCLLTILLTLTLTFSLSACSDGVDGDNEIFGSAAKTYDVDFDEVRVKKQVIGGVFQAMTVEYVQIGKSQEYIPVKLVANAPVEAGKKKEISGTNGALVRVMPKGGNFPQIENGNITFSSITHGENCTGEWYITFMPSSQGSSKTTLNGKFEGTVQQIGDPP